MAHRRGIKGKGNAYARRRKVAGAGVAAGAVVAFGMGPLAGAPPAHADEFDWLGDLVDPLVSSTPAVDSNTWSSWLDFTAWADPMDVPALTGGAVSLDAWLNTEFYTPLHAGIEAWINSPLGEQVDGFINTVSGQFLIGDGVAGTLAHPDGGAGGLLFGDGGDGYYGGDGGDAGWLIGDGGDAGGLAPGATVAALAAGDPAPIDGDPGHRR